MTTCPDVSALSAPGDHSDQIREHLAECETCRALVTLTAANGDETLSEMDETCLAVEPLIAARADSALDDVDEELVMSHVDACERCAAVAATVWLDTEVAQMADPLVSERPVAVPIEVGHAARAEAAPLYRRPAYVAAALAAAALLLIGVWWSRQSARQAAERDILPVEQNATRPAAGRPAPKKPKNKTAAKDDDAQKNDRGDKDEDEAAPPEKPKQRTLPSDDEDEGLPERISRADITSTVQRHRDDINRCADNPEPTRITVTFKVLATGKVAYAAPKQTGSDADCVAKVFRAMKFPAAKKPTTLSYPVVLKARPEVPEEPLSKKEESYRELMDAAKTAAKSSQFGRALRKCEKALAIKSTTDANMVCGIAACNLGSKGKAKMYVGRIRGSGRQQMVRQICLRNGVKLD